MAKTVGTKQLAERVAELERKFAERDKPCQACGHCPSCGRGVAVAPYNPWYPYTAPWVAPYYPPRVWLGTTTQGGSLTSGYVDTTGGNSTVTGTTITYTTH